MYWLFTSCPSPFWTAVVDWLIDWDQAVQAVKKGFTSGLWYHACFDCLVYADMQSRKNITDKNILSHQNSSAACFFCKKSGLSSTTSRAGLYIIYLRHLDEFDEKSRPLVECRHWFASNVSPWFGVLHEIGTQKWTNKKNLMIPYQKMCYTCAD